MVGYHSNHSWWDAEFARYWHGDERPPEALTLVALEDAVAMTAADNENAALDIIADGSLHGDNYTDPIITTTGLMNLPGLTFSRTGLLSHLLANGGKD